MTTMKKLCKIEGEKVQNVEAFYSQVNSATGVQFEHNMDSFNDILKEGFGGETDDDKGIDFVWENANASQSNLGEERFQEILDAIRDHGPEGKRPKDNVYLHLN